MTVFHIVNTRSGPLAINDFVDIRDDLDGLADDEEDGDGDEDDAQVGLPPLPRRHLGVGVGGGALPHALLRREITVDLDFSLILSHICNYIMLLWQLWSTKILTPDLSLVFM